MGCKQSCIIPLASVNTCRKSPDVLSKDEAKAVNTLKNATEDDDNIEEERQREMKVLQQLKDSDTLRKSYVGTGGVAYNVSLEEDYDSMLVFPSWPNRLVKRLDRQTNGQYSREERHTMSEIIKENERSSKVDSARVVAEKQEKARLRREERQRFVCEKFERKRKLTEERLKKLEAKKQERLSRLEESILKRKINPP